MSSRCGSGAAGIGLVVVEDLVPFHHGHVSPMLVLLLPVLVQLVWICSNRE